MPCSYKESMWLCVAMERRYGESLGECVRKAKSEVTGIVCWCVMAREAGRVLSCVGAG